MTSEHQVALTRSQRLPTSSTHISKVNKQMVPAFLQKLYEMVNDPNNAELIRWADAGDSFFVLDHERFAHEVLGRWFKHRNFSSFVRQLNMYGFHKIPHLQQGVLKSDTDTEFWNFAHDNFHRGQPDLLCLIQRKKQVPQPGEEGAIDLRDPNAAVSLIGAPPPGTGAANTNPPPQANTALSPGQILDVNQIFNGISAIKRHQTTISTELNELKRSNQLLWQDALAARAKHQKQQDTINRIVKFLAGVFGHHAGASAGGVAPASPGVSEEHNGKDEGGDGLGVAPVTRRKMRLMIEDAKRDGPRKSMIEELTEIPMDADDAMYDSNYPTIETPISAASPSPSVAMSDNITVADASAYYKNPTMDSALSKSDSGTSTTPSDSPFPTTPQPKPPPTQQQQQGKQLSRAVTPSRSPSFEFDPRIHGVLNQLSPIQIQQLLASLASQTLSDPNSSAPPVPSSVMNPNATTTSGPLAPYLQPSSFDFSINPSSPTGQPSFSTMSMPLVSQEGLIPFEHYSGAGPPTDDRNANLNVANNSTPEQQHEARMEKQWQAAEDIDKDVNALNSSIHSLIQTFGLDPSLLEDNLGAGGLGSTQSHGDDDMHGTAGDGAGLGGEVGSDGAADFDFETFFHNLSSTGSTGLGVDSSSTNGMDYNDIVSTAFLDEVPTPASSSDLTASPMQTLRQVSPEMHLGAPANDVSSTGAKVATNAGTTTTTAGRKRKSEVDFEALGAAMDGQAAAAATTKAGSTGPGKSKRRKDK